MKKILLIAYINNIIDFEFVNNFIYLLRTENNHVFVSIKTKFRIGNIVFNSEKYEDEKHFDLIFLVNTKTSNKYLKYQVPVIQIVNAQDYFRFWSPDNILPVWYYGEKLNNTIIKFNNYIPPFFLSDNEQVNIANKMQLFDIFFIINEESTLLSLIWFINLLHSKKIAVFCHFKNIFKNLLNSNVSYITENDFDKTLAHSKSIIGGGMLISKAVLLLKPTIVIGKHGYGGILTKDNIINQFHNNYSGRVGGVIDELIPLNLLLSDIEELYSLHAQQLNQTKSILETEIDKVHLRLCENIESFFLDDNENFLSLSLIKNLDYTYYLYPSLGQYVVIHSSTNKLLYQIPIEEYKLIEAFENPQKIESIISKLKIKGIPERKLIQILQRFKKYNLLKKSKLTR